MKALVCEMEAVVFDMDGVIFDSEALVMEAWAEVAKRHQMRNIETVCRECLGTNVSCLLCFM